jgi:hypothetical protein
VACSRIVLLEVRTRRLDITTINTGREGGEGGREAEGGGRESERAIEREERRSESQESTIMTSEMA